MRRRALVLLVPLALALSACGADGSVERVSAVSAPAPALDQDLRPLHVEALALVDLVAAASPSAEVAAVLDQVRATQTALLEQVDAELAQAGRTPGEVAALTAVELEAVRSAAGDEAVRLGLDGLLRNHLAAVTRAKADVLEGGDGALSGRVLDDVGADLQAIGTLA